MFENGNIAFFLKLPQSSNWNNFLPNIQKKYLIYQDFSSDWLIDPEETTVFQ